jgi:hypothetical protein
MVPTDRFESRMSRLIVPLNGWLMTFATLESVVDNLRGSPGFGTPR